MNTGAFEHEEEILIYDGASFNVLSVIDEEYNLYQVDCEGEKEHGLKCVITNKEKNKNGWMRVHPYEKLYQTSLYAEHELIDLGK